MLCSIYATQGARLNLKVEGCGCVSDTLIPKTGTPVIGSATLQLCSFVQFFHHPFPFFLLLSVLYIWILKLLWTLRQFSNKNKKVEKVFSFLISGNSQKYICTRAYTDALTMYTHKLHIKYPLRGKAIGVLGFSLELQQMVLEYRTGPLYG